jgi:hypothetical protein
MRCSVPFRERRQLGQALVEFVLVTPLLLVLFFGVVDFTMALRDWIAVTNATREAARFGSLGGDVTTSEIIERAVQKSNDILEPAEVDVGYADVDGDGSNSDEGDSVVVKASHQYEFFTPLVPLLSHVTGGTLPSEMTMHSCTEMRLEKASGTGGASCSCSGG